MSTNSFSKKFKMSKISNSVKNSEEDIRAVRVTAARAFLDSTRDQFLTDVAKAKSRLGSTEAGVLAGPIARSR
jgi:hypothetical protein